MQLPFTFATGEALLYQTGFPLHGFPDSFRGKAKGSKSKKGKVDKSSSDDLDPKSLLGALMSQDESVYVCQPDTEPKMSNHSSVFSEQQSKADGFDGLFSRVGWQTVSNGEVGRCNSKASSFDPLLATLDSLSLDGEETCSNSELFSALENLGLDAEDLELLLLDERMIQVELDPSHIPTLSDLLTNNEILSYIHDSLESGTEGEGCGDGAGFGRDSTAVPHSSRQHIVQLSQQMQRHISSAELPKAPPGSANTNDQPAVPSSHWVEKQPSNPAHQHAALKAPQPNGEHRQLSSLQQWQQDQQPVHLHQQLSTNGTLLLGFQNQLGLTTDGSYIQNGRPVFPPNEEAIHSDHSMSSTPQAGGAALNGLTAQDGRHYQSLAAAQPCHTPGHLKHQPAPQQSQCPAESSALDLEQFLALSEPQHGPPSLEAYSMFSSTQDSTHGKVRAQKYRPHMH